MSDPVKAWQCIGCGSIEAPQTCIGVCQHRKVEFVYAFEHQATLDELAHTRAERDRLIALLRRMAHVTPRHGDWQGTLQRFQRDARDALALLRHPGGAKRAPSGPAAAGARETG